jgi:hypothetical protein
MISSKRRNHSGKNDPPSILTIGLVIAIALNLSILFPAINRIRLPGNHQGYEPKQPIQFSHRLHSGDLEMDCLYCHPAAERGRFAGFPSAGQCMNCHRFVRSTLGVIRAEEEAAQEEGRETEQVVSDELEKLYNALGLSRELEPENAPSPIVWVRVHRLPDYAYFNHSAHVNSGIYCRDCHGPVEKMVWVSQENSLSMGWCVNCHRDYRGRTHAGRELQPSIDCSSCHF